MNDLDLLSKIHTEMELSNKSSNGVDAFEMAAMPRKECIFTLLTSITNLFDMNSVYDWIDGRLLHSKSLTRPSIFNSDLSHIYI